MAELIWLNLWFDFLFTLMVLNFLLVDERFKLDDDAKDEAEEGGISDE